MQQKRRFDQQQHSILTSIVSIRQRPINPCANLVLGEFIYQFHLVSLLAMSRRI